MLELSPDSRTGNLAEFQVENQIIVESLLTLHHNNLHYEYLEGFRILEYENKPKMAYSRDLPKMARQTERTYVCPFWTYMCPTLDKLGHTYVQGDTGIWKKQNCQKFKIECSV